MACQGPPLLRKFSVISAFTICCYGQRRIRGSGGTQLARQGHSAVARRAQAFDPVRRHPLFSAAAAWWFAALFGLSALAIRTDQLEALVLLAGNDHIAPVIAEPFGWAARMIVALGCAVVGGLTGLVAGSMLAIPHAIRCQPAASPFRASPAGAAERRPAAAKPASGAGLQSGFADSADAVALGGLVRGTAAEKLLAADLTTLSPIQLVERLGIALQGHISQAHDAVCAYSGMELGPPVSSPEGQAPSASRCEIRFALGDGRQCGETGRVGIRARIFV